MLSSLATVAATTKRSTVAAGGKKAAPSAYLTALLCTPPTATDPGQAGALLQRLKLDTPYQLFDTQVLGQPDIIPGDLLVVGTREFVIRAVSKWGRAPGTLFTYLTGEEIL